MSKIRKNSILILLITIIIIFLIIKDNFLEIMNILINSNFLFLFLTLLVYVVHYVFDQMSLYLLVKKANPNIEFSYMLKLGMITKFFNGITPLATGGQPAIVYYLTKKKVKAEQGTNIIIQNYIAFQIVLVFISSLGFIYNAYANIFSTKNLLFNLTLLGYIINVVILIGLFFVGFSKKFSISFTKLIINFLYKIKLVKNKKNVINKWTELCNNYNNSADLIRQDKKRFSLATLSQFISQVLFYALPFFMALSLNALQDLTLLNAIILGSLIYVMGCYVPIPGASGGMEYAFLGFIGIFIHKPKLLALLLLWRFITYYLPTILGAIIFNIETTPKEKKSI